MLADDRPHVGNTGVANKFSKLAGIAPRWSEHVRELQNHMTGTAPKERQRRMCQVLQAHLASSCLDFIILDHCPPDTIAKREAVAIAQAHPEAHGSELKHISEVFRPPRKRQPKQSWLRPSQSKSRKTVEMLASEWRVCNADKRPTRTPGN